MRVLVNNWSDEARVASLEVRRAKRVSRHSRVTALANQGRWQAGIKMDAVGNVIGTCRMLSECSSRCAYYIIND